MSFTIACRKFADSVPVRNSMVFRKIVFDLYAEIVKRSPVDTGLFRGNWRIGAGSAPSGTIDRKSTSPRGIAAEISNVPKEVKETTTVYIVNNLEYALPLERGWSGQAPQGVVQPSVNAILAALQGR